MSISFNNPDSQSDLKIGKGSSYGQTHFGPKEANFEPYDPVHWEIAAQKASVDESPSEDGADSPITPDDVKEEVSESSKPAPTVPTSKPEFVRALKDSKAEQMMPYYKKGDILRVINKTSWGNLDGESEGKNMEILPRIRN